MTQKKRYHVNQSPFYKLGNHRRLAKILCISPHTLKKVIRRGDNNYKFGSTESGRSVQIPKTQLLRIHKRLNYLFMRIEAPNYLVSGVKGRSHVYNAMQHVGELSVAKTDIQRFYPSTTYTIVKKGFRKIFKCSEDIAQTLSLLCTVKGHVPTGSPISQSLSFIVNAPVFDEINRYAKSRGLNFTLYVDDLTFSGEAIPKNFLSNISGILKKKRGYKCHKFRTYDKRTEKVITGVVVRENKIDLKRTHKKLISDLSRRKEYYSSAEMAENTETMKYFQRLIGHLFSAGQVSPRYRQIGYSVVRERKQLGVLAQNQNTAN